MTRPAIEPPLFKWIEVDCNRCHGRGYVVSELVHDPFIVSFLTYKTTPCPVCRGKKRLIQAVMNLEAFGPGCIERAKREPLDE